MDEYDIGDGEDGHGAPAASSGSSVHAGSHAASEHRVPEEAVSL